MSNDTRVKQEAPERVWLLLNQEGRWISTTPEAAQYVGGAEYVRANLLATVRREEREAAFKDAIAIVMQRGEILHRGNLVAALEASVDSEKGEGNGSDQTTKET